MSQKFYLYDNTSGVINLILSHFRKKYGVGAIFLHSMDAESSDLFENQKQTFCELCQKGDSVELARLCHADHLKRAFAKQKIAVINQCYLGLYNVSFPIVIEGNITATLLIGQVKIKGKEKDAYQKAKKFLRNSNFDLPNADAILSRCESINTLNESVFNDTVIPEGRYIAKLIQALLEQERFSKIRMSSIAHELLLPIQSIIIDSETLKDETYDDQFDIEFIRENASSILLEVSKLNMHINNLRRVVKFSVVDFAYDFVETNIFPMIETARTTFKKEADLKGIVLRKQTFTQRKFPSLFLVKEELSIALNNLYSNAIKYSYSQNRFKDERFITTECYTTMIQSKNFFVIEISNFGVPIKEEEIEGGLIYQAGYRSEYSKDRNRTGSGIGLFLVKDIIERIHKGIIEVHSTHKGNGNYTTVKICLPYEREIYNATREKL
ncbi:PocR ligand-binding domain-containing protein [Desulfobacula phenolica]|uniref:Signal transduction histidine kinase n=1 Tax=Desulfobacula phenolica TaxID=90732 RepID=A0A1H2KB04_9BACT|nr:PocR ligand-binding domain-containing protein [Desulfobacula phenolica]SDU65849.1 Signal transduction histidine kinase [Desulfobacula phenolica]